MMSIDSPFLHESWFDPAFHYSRFPAGGFACTLTKAVCMPLARRRLAAGRSCAMPARAAAPSEGWSGCFSMWCAAAMMQANGNAALIPIQPITFHETASFSAWLRRRAAMPLDPCRVRVRLRARTATQAGSVLPEFPAALPATLLPDEKIDRLHPGRDGLESV
jgi:hypothetical protein